MKRRWLCGTVVLPGLLALACEAGDAPKPRVSFDLGSTGLREDVRDIQLQGYLNAGGLSCDEFGRLVGTPPETATVYQTIGPTTFRATFAADAGSWIFHVTMGNDDFPIDGTKRLAEGCLATAIEGGTSPQITIEMHDLRREVYCGDGVLDPAPTAGHCPCPTEPTTPCTWYCEECDPPGGSCGPDCQFLPDVCGNSRVEATETCDDGNTTAGDGCFNCQTESFRLNAYPGGAQTLPRVAAGLVTGGAENFAAVWMDESGATPDIMIAYWGTAGPSDRPLGAGRFEVLVNATAARRSGTQTSPAVGWGRSGFLVTYIDQSTAADWNLWSVAYDSGRSARRSPPEELVPSTAGAATDNQAVVGAHPQQDGFVVVWTRGTSPARKIYARRFPGDGLPVAPDFQVQVAGTEDEFLPAVAVASDGSFAVAWVQGRVDTTIQLARFDATGTITADGVQQANTTDVGLQSEPSLAFDTGRRLLVAWSDGDESSIRARLYPATGAAADDFRVSESTVTAGSLELGRLTTSVAASGVTFLVVWAAQSQSRVFGRLVTDAGTFARNRITSTNGEFHLSPDPGSDPATTPVDPSRARVAITPSGKGLVVWQDGEGAGAPGVDPPGGVWGRMLPVP